MRKKREEEFVKKVEEILRSKATSHGKLPKPTRIGLTVVKVERINESW